MPLTRDTPKCLLELGDGTTILERQLQAAEACGAESVRVVTGYRSEQIEAKLAGHHSPEIETIHNPFFRLANNLASAWLGLRDVEPPVVLLNGDDVFEPVVLTRLLECPDEIVAVVSRKPAYDEEDMKVVLSSEGSITRFGKDVPLDAAEGEAIGMTLLRDGGLRSLQQALAKMLRDEANFGQLYEAAFELMIAEGVRFDLCPCAPEEWAEIDFPVDLEAVRRSLAHQRPAAGA
jgi:choline kinase